MDVSLAATKNQLRQLLEDAAFRRQYGFRLHAVADGSCTLHVPFQETFERPGGVVSGQVFMAAADVAMWLAIMTRLGITDMSVTIEMTTAFLNGARNEDFHCTARILKMGKQLVCQRREEMSHFLRGKVSHIRRARDSYSGGYPVAALPSSC